MEAHLIGIICTALCKLQTVVILLLVIVNPTMEILHLQFRRSSSDIYGPLRPDSLGNVQWSKTYGGNMIDVGCVGVQLNNGEFLV